MCYQLSDEVTSRAEKSFLQSQIAFQTIHQVSNTKS